VIDGPDRRLPIDGQSPILLRTAEREDLAPLGVEATGSRLITRCCSSAQTGVVVWSPGMRLATVLLGTWFRFAVWIVVFLEFPGEVRR
jgi:hypothetical protein